jgi:hypothetical protein
VDWFYNQWSDGFESQAGYVDQMCMRNRNTERVRYDKITGEK